MLKKIKPIRLVVDTNLWISFLISKRLVALDKLLYSNKILFLFCEELINEVQVTITKLKLRKYFSDADNALEEMLVTFDPYIQFVEVKSHVTVCRDNADNFLLALSKDGKADFLVTGDKDLLSIRKFEKTNIITFNDFTRISL